MDEITVHEQISPTVEFADLPKVLKESDFITIHVPALPATKGMINADAIAQMKDGVVFLNFSRDVLVDDAAMAEALESGKVAAYVTDFANPAVVKMERAIVIPHLAPPPPRPRTTAPRWPSRKSWPTSSAARRSTA